MHDEGQVQCLQERDAGIGAARRVHDHRIHPLAGGEPAVGGRLVRFRLDGRDENVDAVLLQPGGEPAHEFAGMRPEAPAALEDDADRTGPAGGKPLRADVRPIAEPLRRIQNTRRRVSGRTSG
jgi:hypothetical protein